MKKTLVTYFSASGTTERTAKEIAETVGAEMNLLEHCPKADWKQGKLVNSGAGAWAKSVLGE